MNIAELFINLGIKGDAKTLGGILGIKKGLKDTASASLEAKAAIVGVMYGLERMFAQSSAAGQNLTNFNALVGVSAQTLQQYQYAGRQVGVANEAIAGTFKNLQSAMTKTLLGEGAPKLALARIGQVLGEGFTAKDVEEYTRNPEKLFAKLQQYAMKEKSLPLRNEIFKNLGIGEDVAAAMARNAFRPEQLAKAPTYSDREVAQLDKAATAWSNIGTKIEMAFGHFNAKHGVEITKEIDMIVGKISKLAESFDKLATKAELFKKLGMVFEGWDHIFTGITKAIDYINGVKAEDLPKLPGDVEPVKNLLPGEVGYDEQKKKTQQEEDGKKLRGMMLDSFLELYQKTFGGGLAESADKFKAKENLFQPGKVAGATVVEPPSKAKLVVVPSPMPHAKQVATPKVSPAAVTAASVIGGANPPTQNNVVNQTLNFAHPGVDPQKTADSTKTAVKQAYRQSSAQGEGG